MKKEDYISPLKAKVIQSLIRKGYSPERAKELTELKKNTSVSLSIKTKEQIILFLDEFEKQTGFQISVAEFVRTAVKERLEKVTESLREASK